MLYKKETILAVLGGEGDAGRLDRARGELPEVVDTERDGRLLAELGVDPAALPDEVQGATHGEAGTEHAAPGFESGPG